MTTIPMYLARWHYVHSGYMSDVLAVSPDVEYTEAFRRVRLEALFMDGLLTLAPSRTGGNKLFLTNSCSNRERSWRYKFEGGSVLGDGASAMPRFAWHLVEMDVEDDGTMTWLLPPVHELPWPDLWGVCAVARRRVALEELPTRARSCMAALDGNMRGLAMGVPDWVRLELTGAEWMTAMRGEDPCT